MTARTAEGRNGIVATGHAHASEAALAMLQSGGNAVDAAITAALVLCVVCPYAVTLGGDLYAMVFEPRGAKVAGLNATGCAPEAATPDRFTAGIPGTGVLSATVPGMLRGLGDLHQRFGTRDWGALLQPAIALAADGFTVHAQLAANTAERAALLAKDPAARAIFLPADAPLAVGTHFAQPQLARILQRLAADGADDFYEGELAAAMTQASARIGGLLGAADLAEHRSLWQEPIAAPFYGCDVLTMPPNSFGATLLFQLLRLEADAIDGVDPNSVEFIRHGHAARRAAYAQVARLIADPQRTEAKLRQTLAAAIAAPPAETAGRTPAEARDRCTTCVVVIDRDGMAVSLIESVSAPYGAGVVLEDTGILLNNRMAGFNTDPASDNCVAPMKRPANTLAPCLVLQGGKLMMSLGTPGTVGQTCTLAQFLARTLACGEDPAAAAAAPRWSVDFQGKLVVEDTMAPALRNAVLAHHPEARAMREGWISFGSIKLAMVNGTGLRGVADHRRVATTLGW